MNSTFEDPLFREININDKITGNIIKAVDSEDIGLTKISIDEDSDESVKVILKKDEFDSVKEIKFICSCGHTKSIILDYSE